MMTPEMANKLDVRANEIENLRIDMLFEEGTLDTMENGEPAYHFLMALACLEQAHRAMQLAALKAKEATQ